LLPFHNQYAYASNNFDLTSKDFLMEKALELSI